MSIPFLEKVSHESFQKPVFHFPFGQKLQSTPISSLVPPDALTLVP